MAAELKKALERRRAQDESVVFDGSDFQEKRAPVDVERTSIGGKESWAVPTFRSGWTNTPKVEQRDKPKDQADSPKRGVTADGAAQSGKLPQRALVKDELWTTALRASNFEKAQEQRMAESERAQDQQLAQKARLDKLHEFASSENDRLTELLKLAEQDKGRQSERTQKLLESKAAIDKVLNDTVKQRDQLEAKLQATQAERDALRDERDELSMEKTRLESVVESSSQETERLKEVVASVQREKAELEVIVERKSQLEQELACVKAQAAELETKAKHAERLEQIMEKGEAERARLERLLADSSGENEKLLKQKEAFDKTFAELQRQNDRLHTDLAKREEVQRQVQVLEEENAELKAVAEASKEEQRRLEEVLATTSSQNQELQQELVKAATRHSELEQRTAVLEREGGELRQAAQEAGRREAAAMCERDQAMASAAVVEERRAALEERVATLEQENRRVTAALEQPSSPGAAVAGTGGTSARQSYGRVEAAGSGSAPAAPVEVKHIYYNLDQSSTTVNNSMQVSASEGAETGMLARQLCEALHHNSELQKRIEALAVAKPAKAEPMALPAPEQQAPTQIGRLLDSWMDVLDDAASPAASGQIVRAPSSSAAQESSGSWMYDWMFGAPQ